MKTISFALVLSLFATGAFCQHSSQSSSIISTKSTNSSIKKTTVPTAERKTQEKRCHDNEITAPKKPTATAFTKNPAPKAEGKIQEKKCRDNEITTPRKESVVYICPKCYYKSPMQGKCPRDGSMLRMQAD